MKKRTILATLAATSLALATLSSCSFVSNKTQAEQQEMVNLLASNETLSEDKIKNINVATMSANYNKIYVSPTGVATNEGTKESPVDFLTAIHKATPGTNILLAKGTYNYSERINVGKSVNDIDYVDIDVIGKPGQYIVVQPDFEITQTDRVIFDFSEMEFDDSNRGLQVYGDYWYFYGIDVRGAGDNGMYVAGNHNIVDRCVFYNNRDTGLQLGRSSSRQSTQDKWPSFNLVRNCTSFANFDGKTKGENADGFAAKLTVGNGNIFDGCIAFRNSDDGWDLFAKPDSGNIGTVTLYNCVSFENGFLPYSITDAEAKNDSNPFDTRDGDGIGFKLGGSTMVGDVVVENCMAFDNKLHGVGDNSNPGFISVKNFTAYNNCAGINTTTGDIGDTRGPSYVETKSNNIDLARNDYSYNDYYGIFSYIDNQDKFELGENESYNTDMYRGSTAYCLFQTDYDTTNKKEKYIKFGDVVEASYYKSDKNDKSFTAGTSVEFTENPFVSSASINAKCETVEDLPELVKYDYQFRNADGSVNMGDHLKIKDSVFESLYGTGTDIKIGADLTKTSDEYTHPDFYAYTSNSNITPQMANGLSAYSALTPITNLNATYQDFDVPNLYNMCNITWTSSDPTVLQVMNNEVASKSMSVESTIHVIPPKEKKTVQLTAKIENGEYTLEKTFMITVLPRQQYIEKLVSSHDDVIKVLNYADVITPRIYAIDGSSAKSGELSTDIYTLTYKYEYAYDENSKFYPVDGVYSSVSGLYRVTVTGKMDEGSTDEVTYVYTVFVPDADCEVDFKGTPNVVLTGTGYSISGDLSNVDGYVKAFTSDTKLDVTTINREEKFGKEAEVESVAIEKNSIIAPFTADNNAAKPYFIYYIVVNRNHSNLETATIREAEVKVKTISTKEEFNSLARKGAPDEGEYDSLTIFSLSNDLDFTGVTWNLLDKDTAKEFKGLFNGNNHTIKNIVIDDEDTGENLVNIFYKVTNGSIINVKFDGIAINAKNCKTVGIVGRFKGGYIYNVHVTNSTFYGIDSVGGIVGQATGGDCYVERCSFVNPATFYEKATGTYESGVTYYKKTGTKYETIAKKKVPVGEAITDDDIYILPTTYRVSASSKYIGGIMGNAQIADSATYLALTIKNCYVTATIGDGKDSGGYNAGILGRVKDDDPTAAKSGPVTINVFNCFYEGMVIAGGNYNSGIVGGIEKGFGTINVSNNFSFVNFVLKGDLLDAELTWTTAWNSGTIADVQTFAHKNCNPIIGRAVNTTAIYNCVNNYGTWKENYKSLVGSRSAWFDDQVSDIEPFVITKALFETYLKFDLENIWEWNETTKRVTLR